MSRDLSPLHALPGALKVRDTPSQASLTVTIDPVNSSFSKSALAMPAHKAVRFHSQFENVRLFLSKQKPRAVPRDGNRTDTSGADSEFPPPIHARNDDLKDRPLVIHHIDVPSPLPLTEDTRDVAVESIDLVGTTVEGVVRVRNIAFEKWVAVRFTLDKWQTTSEVTASYKESPQNGIFNRFMFSIKLAEVFSWAEEKTLYLAVRYSVAGREIWDNNNGRNYRVQVVREKEQEVNNEAVVESRDESSGDIADLLHKLEQVVKVGCPSETISGILAQESRRRRESLSHTSSPPPHGGIPSFKSEGFDIVASSRTPRRPTTAHQKPSHARTNTNPSTRQSSISFPGRKSRDRDGDRDADDGNLAVPSLSRRRRSGARNHTRGGSIDRLDAPCVKRTPPTSLFGSPVPPPFDAVCLAVCQFPGSSTYSD